VKFEIKGGEIPLDSETDEYDLAIQACSLLVNEPWVRLRTDAGFSTQWTVLERDNHGTPVQIAYEEFNGSTGVLFHA
jgi:hypothetical protein